MYSRFRQAVRRTFDDVRDSHLWRLLLWILPIAVLSVGWISYHTEQDIADIEHGIELKRVSDEYKLFDQRSSKRREAGGAFITYMNQKLEIIGDGNSLDDVAYKKVLSNYATLPNIKKEFVEDRQDLEGVRFYSAVSEFLNALASHELRLGDTELSILDAEIAEWQAISSGGRSTFDKIVAVNPHKNWDVAEEKISELENDISNVERVQAANGLLSRVAVVKYEHERANRLLWIRVGQISIGYIVLMLLALSAKFGAEFRKARGAQRPAGFVRRGL
jgi:hypothetical protein